MNRRWIYRLLAVPLAMTLSGWMTSAALAGLGQDDYPAGLKALPAGSTSEPWGFANRNCTSFVAWRMNQLLGSTSAPWAFTNTMGGGHWGDANHWDDNAVHLGYPVNSTPAIGAIAQTDAGTFGHVGVVTAIGVGTIMIEEYNYGFTGNYGMRTVAASSFSYIHVADQASNAIVRIEKATFGSSQQVYSATRTRVYESWWDGGSGVHTTIAVAVPAGEEIVDIDKITQMDGVTQSIYTATRTGVYETWWRPGTGFSNPSKIVSLANVQRVVADLRLENNAPTHRLYVLAADGPYEYWWRDGGTGVSDGYRLWNINGGHSILKTTAIDGTDEVYVGTPTNVYRMKWPVAGGIERTMVTQLADTVDIQKHTKADGTELLYTVTKTGVHETWWNASSGYSNPAKIINITNGEEVVTAVKTVTGGWEQMYVATRSRVFEFFWQPGGTIGSGELIHIAQNNIVDIEKTSDGAHQNLYTAHQDVVWETWWGNGAFVTTAIIDL